MHPYDKGFDRGYNPPIADDTRSISVQCQPAPRYGVG